MKTKNLEMIASSLKEARIAKGFTQKELSDLTNISVRSIQRIENGELVARSYTLKTLAAALGISLETEEMPDKSSPVIHKMNKAQKIIITAGLPLFVFFASWAFIAQSARFPETLFELLVFATIMIVLLTIALYFIWKKN
jgi:transcriptional regulator with XRE-family HTH domain